MFQSYRGQAEVETLRPHPVELQRSEASLASSACDMQACLRAGNMVLSDGQAGEAPDDLISSPAEFGHPKDKIKTGEPARKKESREESRL